MSGPGLLAALAVLLGTAGARELLRGSLASLESLPFGLGSRSAAAALRLGIPERLRRAGMEGRLSLPAVLAGKALGLAVGAAVEPS